MRRVLVIGLLVLSGCARPPVTSNVTEGQASPAAPCNRATSAAKAVGYGALGVVAATGMVINAVTVFAISVPLVPLSVPTALFDEAGVQGKAAATPCE